MLFVPDLPGLNSWPVNETGEVGNEQAYDHDSRQTTDHNISAALSGSGIAQWYTKNVGNHNISAWEEITGWGYPNGGGPLSSHFIFTGN